MRKHLPLILAFSLPILMTALVALSIFIPRLYIKPKYSFLFLESEYGNGIYRYTVSNNQLTRQESTHNAADNSFNSLSPQIYLYDVNTDSQKLVSFEEAMRLPLDPLGRSPDGFELIHGSSGSGFFLFYNSSDYSNWYLQKDNVTKKLNITNADYRYSINFLGWVLE